MKSHFSANQREKNKNPSGLRQPNTEKPSQRELSIHLGFPSVSCQARAWNYQYVAESLYFRQNLPSTSGGRPLWVSTSILKDQAASSQGGLKGLTSLPTGKGTNLLTTECAHLHRLQDSQTKGSPSIPSVLPHSYALSLRPLLKGRHPPNLNSASPTKLKLSTQLHYHSQTTQSCK